jgi:organic radical activating enzyme
MLFFADRSRNVYENKRNNDTLPEQNADIYVQLRDILRAKRAWQGQSGVHSARRVPTTRCAEAVLAPAPSRLRSGEEDARSTSAAGSAEKLGFKKKNIPTQRRQGAKTRKEQPLWSLRFGEKLTREPSNFRRERPITGLPENMLKTKAEGIGTGKDGEDNGTQRASSSAPLRPAPRTPYNGISREGIENKGRAIVNLSMVRGFPGKRWAPLACCPVAAEDGAKRAKAYLFIWVAETKPTLRRDLQSNRLNVHSPDTYSPRLGTCAHPSRHLPSICHAVGSSFSSETGGAMRNRDVIPAWGRVLQGRKPLLSIEITKECPLHCPGCYAYGPEHLGGAGTLRQLSDYKGDDLVAGVLGLVRRLRPLHVSIVGGEPLVRYRELEVLLPKLGSMGIEVMVVTSAVRPIPESWRHFPNLHLSVSIDGLQPEHDRRRAPATYDRILKHIAGHGVNIHCTITRQLLQRRDYLRDFARFWSAREEVRKIWFSLYTPQQGEVSEERLTPEDRAWLWEELCHLRQNFPRVDLPNLVLQGYQDPPSSPEGCIFAQTTTCVSSDMTTAITPCQFGGRPVCAECGCMASAGLAAVAKYKLAGLVQIGALFTASRKLGERMAGLTA